MRLRNKIKISDKLFYSIVFMVLTLIIHIGSIPLYNAVLHDIEGSMYLNPLNEITALYILTLGHVAFSVSIGVILTGIVCFGGILGEKLNKRIN